MKRYLVLSFVAMLTLPSYGQIPRGHIPRGTLHAGVSATGAMTFTGNPAYAQYSAQGFTLQPSMGWFVTDNLSMGLAVDGYAGNMTERRTYLRSNPNSLGGSLMARYYLPMPSATDKVYPLVAVEYGWQRGRTSAEHDELTSGGGSVLKAAYASAATNFKAGAGIAWFMTRRLSFEAKLNYNHRKHINLDADTQLRFSGWAIEAGIRRWMFRGQL